MPLLLNLLSVRCFDMLKLIYAMKELDTEQLLNVYQEQKWDEASEAQRLK